MPYHFFFSLCNIENISTSIEHIIKGKIPSGIYNLSDSKEYTYNELLKFQKAKFVVPIPLVFIKILYYLGSLFKNTFLRENALKLMSNNIYPSEKICSYLKLPSSIYDIQFKYD